MTVAIADMQPLALFQVPRYWIVDSRHLLLLSPSSPAHLLCTNPNIPAVQYRSPRRPLSCCFSSSNPLAPPSGSAGDDGDHEDETHYKQKAIEAVSDILQKNGICEEESMEIAMKSPNYVQMLMDSVADLDQLYRSTSSISSMEYKDSIVDYQKKVFDMGIQKGDKGLVPVLESVVGLPLPSAIHIARYISSSAPHTSTAKILHKVKYVKEILFSDVDGKAPVGTCARRMMMHLSLSVDEDVQHTLSFLEKIQARRGGLDMLGSGDGPFRYLIESFPRLMLLSVESNFKPMVDYLAHIGVPNGRIRNILLLYPPILFYDIDRQIKPTLQLFTKVHGEDPEFGKMLLKYPWILSKSIQKNYEQVGNLLYAEKVAEASIHKAVKSWPLLLGCSVGKLKLMIDQFRELGVTEKVLHKVITTSPQLLTQKPREFCQVITYLKGLGLDEDGVGRILGRCPEVFMTNIDKTLKKKVEFLDELGISKKHLPRVIRKYPEFFVCDVDNSLLPRMRYLKKIGLSKREIAFMVGRFSPLLGYSIEEVLRPKYEFLVNTMQKPLAEVVEYPRYFSYSLEKKIKPRFWVIKGMNCECSLKDMLGRNDEEFAADYMSGLATTVVPPSRMRA